VPVLYHVSDRPGIERFEPRRAPSSALDEPLVWAVEERLLHNYLLLARLPAGDVLRRAGQRPGGRGAPAGRHSRRPRRGDREGVARTTRWKRLYIYELSSDVPAGRRRRHVHVSAETVTPRAVRLVDHVLGALVERDVDLRITPSLWPLRDLVVASTLAYSMIRMRNAKPI
jgi:hypothetical protein